MIKAIRLTLIVITGVLLLTLLTALALAFYTLEKEPLARQSTPVNHTTVTEGKALVKRILDQVERAGDGGTTLAVTESEFGHLAQMGSHTFKRLTTDVVFDRTSINSRLSLRLLPNPAGEYLNLAFRVGQSSTGLRIDRLAVGPLEIRAAWLLPLAAGLLDTLLPDKQASLLLASIRGFRLEGDTALFEVQPPPNVKAELKQVVKSLQATRLPRGESERAVHYYDLLVATGRQGRRRGRSLGDFMTPLMAEAAARSTTGSAVAENRAVIWALAIYFSYGAIETLVGDLVSSERQLAFPAYGVTLGGRRDLMAHFVYSAGITLATEQGIGVAAGEFKELLDAGNGGSGFSFADLAADRAGIRFVGAAITSESSARQLQQGLIATPGEAAFFPDVSGLDEGLSEAQLQQQYGSVQSEGYRHQLDLIDRRIEHLPVYQGLLTPSE